jgi:hypothetical protein
MLGVNHLVLESDTESRLLLVRISGLLRTV